MGEYTQYFQFYKPNVHEQNWGDTVNANFDKIDTALQEWDNAFNGELNSNLKKIRDVTVSVSSGPTDAGTQRVTIATDDANLSSILSYTSTISTNLASIKSSFGSDGILSVKLKNYDGTTDLGVQAHPLIVDFSPSKVLQFRQTDNSGNPISYNGGTIDAGTQRMVLASDDLTVTNMVKLGGAVVTGGGLKVNLRDTSGSIIGTPTNPIYIAGQVTTPSSVEYDRNSGNATSSTMRVVTASNDPNLAAIKTICEENVVKISESIVPVAEVMEAGFPALFRSPANKSMVPNVDPSGNVLVSPAGDMMPVVLRNAANFDIGTEAVPLKVMLVSDPGSTASTNVDLRKIRGSDIDTNTGNASGATQRVTVATDDVNLSGIHTKTGAISTAVLKITDDTTGYFPAMITKQQALLDAATVNGVKVSGITNTVPVQLINNLGTTSNPIVVQQQSASGTGVNPWLAWHSFFAQSASCYKITTPYALKQLSSDATSTQEITHVLTTRQFSKYTHGSVDSADWVIPAGQTSVTRQVNFILDENIKSNFTVPRRIRFKTTVNVRSETTGSATTISEVKMSLFKLTGTDTLTELASYTYANMDFTTTDGVFVANDIVVMGMYTSTNDAINVLTTDTIGMSVRITVTTAAANGDVRIKHSAGTNQTYVEFLN